jgi:hypothetical protein
VKKRAASAGPRILGPLSHGRTTSLAVSPSDSNVIAVAGWTSVSTNEGAEPVFISHDGGVSWTNVTAGIREATGVAGKTRAGGLLLVDLLENNERALLASTSNGVVVLFAGITSQTAAAAAAGTTGTSASVENGWVRFGGCDEFPIVLNAGLSYEPYSDTLVAATFGRGIYRLDNAKQALLNVRACVAPHKSAQVAERSSAEHFPAQL